MLLHDAIWKLCKDKPLPHHLVNMAVYISLTTLFYAVCRKYLPQDIAFLATLFYVVHPCNAQMAGWISGKGYMQAAIIGLLALYFNNVVFYLISLFAHPIAFSIIIIMSLPIYVKALGLILALYLFGIYAVEGKINQTKSEGLFKIDNMRLYPRKFIVAIKSFAYYFCLAMFPGKMGWFHEIGEPIDEKIKSANLHFALSLLLLAAISLFFAHPAFIGLLLFCLMIAPFTNLITPALFTSERYMGMALMGWSIFLAYTLHSYPIACGVIICAYFMRTQLELWAYQDDFHLALYSLLNFPKNGFAWCNMAHLLLAIERKPSAAFDLLCETRKRLPEFPTTYYQLYLMYRAQDLLANFDEAMNCLEKACHYGKHEGWYRDRKSVV